MYAFKPLPYDYDSFEYRHKQAVDRVFFEQQRNIEDARRELISNRSGRHLWAMLDSWDAQQSAALGEMGELILDVGHFQTFLKAVKRQRQTLAQRKKIAGAKQAALPQYGMVQLTAAHERIMLSWLEVDVSGYDVFVSYALPFRQCQVNAPIFGTVDFETLFEYVMLMDASPARVKSNRHLCTITCDNLQEDGRLTIVQGRDKARFVTASPLSK